MHPTTEKEEFQSQSHSRNLSTDHTETAERDNSPFPYCDCPASLEKAEEREFSEGKVSPLQGGREDSRGHNSSSLDSIEKSVTIDSNDSNNYTHKENISSCENKENQFVTYTRCENCGALVRHKMRCHKRFSKQCEYCSEQYRKKWFAKYSDAWEKMDSPKLVTLTLKKKGSMVSRLKELSSLARRCRFYLKRRGYKIKKHLWVMEPPNHIHALWDTNFIPQHELSEIWNTISGDSFIVDIRKASNRHGAKYLLKYLGKASEWSELNLEALKSVHITGSWEILEDTYQGFKCPNCGKRNHVRINERYYDEEKHYREYKDKPPPAG